MRLYLPGPQGPDQLATKWLLVQRGYQCVCATDVASKEYAREDAPPGERLFRERQMNEMQMADAVVLEDELLDDTAAVLHVLHVCRFAGIRVVRHDELPALAPSLAAREGILDARDLTHVEREPMSTRMRQQVKSALARVEGWARRFDARWGWFFTNGQKAAAPKPYPMPDEQPLTTT